MKPSNRSVTPTASDKALRHREHWIIIRPQFEALLEIIPFEAVRNQPFRVETLSFGITRPETEYPENLVAKSYPYRSERLSTRHFADHYYRQVGAQTDNQQLAGRTGVLGR